MTSYLQRLVAREEVADRTDPPPGAAVRPRVAARFEPAGDTDPVGAGPPAGRSVVGEPARVHADAPTGWTDRRPAVHRGALVEPATEMRAPLRPAEASPVIPPASPPGPLADLAVAPTPRPEAPGRPGGASGPPRPAPTNTATPVSGDGQPAPDVATDPASRPIGRRRAGHHDRAPVGTTPTERRVDAPPLPVRPAPAAALRPEVGQRQRTAPPGSAGTEQQVVHVTIGRVEIRTAPAATGHGRADPSAPMTPDRANALEKYLVDRAGGRRR